MTDMIATAVPDRLARLHRVLERLQLLALLVRALLPGHHPGDGPGLLARRPDQPHQQDEDLRELQLPRSVAPPDQRQPLLVDHHLHRQPRLPEHPQEVLVRDSVAADPGSARAASRPIETFLANWITNNQQQRIVETENYYNNEDLGHADRRAADQRRDRRQLRRDSAANRLGRWVSPQPVFVGVD